MKKTAIILSALILIAVGFTGCGEKKEEKPAESVTPQASQTAKPTVSNVDDKYLVCENIMLDSGFSMGHDDRPVLKLKGEQIKEFNDLLKKDTWEEFEGKKENYVSFENSDYTISDSKDKYISLTDTRELLDEGKQYEDKTFILLKGNDNFSKSFVAPGEILENITKFIAEKTWVAE